MLICPVCGAQENDDARFCTVCGRRFIPRPVGHDFTTGVMRYVPEAEREAEAVPRYVMTQAVTPPPSGALSMPQHAPDMPVPQTYATNAQSFPPAGGGSGKKQVSATTLFVVCAISFLVLLIIIGITYLLGGAF